MKKNLKLFFLAHPDNIYQPHLLHRRRTIFYGSFFLTMKAFLIVFSILLPSGFFLTPEVLAAEQEKLLRLTNAFRIAKGIAYLKENSELNASAHLRAADMAVNQYVDHFGPHHRPLAYFLEQANYQYGIAGENLYMGPLLAENIMLAWERSPTHYANLVDLEYTEAGFDVQGGIFEGQPIAYAALHFGTPLGTASAIQTENIPKETLAQPPTVSRLSSFNKYIWARNSEYPLTQIFHISQGIYFFAFALFSGVLLLNIAIHVRHKHYHIVAQTFSLLFLITILIFV
ncbi:MAG: CAP domain-containing protein [Patescibacteria group bacterium]